MPQHEIAEMSYDVCKARQKAATPAGRDARRGVLLVLVAICLPLLLLGAAFAVDLSYLRVARNEFRFAADAAARSAGSVYSKTQNVKQAIAAAKTAGELNVVVGKPLMFEDGDIEFGSSEYDERTRTWDFTPGGEPTNAIRVTARKSSDAPSGKIDLFFSQALFEMNIALTSEAISVAVDPEVMYTLDRSGTMAYPEDAPSDELIPPPQLPGWAWCQEAPDITRRRKITKAVEKSLARLEPDQRTWAGLVTFADDGATDAKFGKKFQAIRDALADRTATFCGGLKRIDRGVQKTVLEITSNSPSSGLAEQHVVLITDGKHVSGELLESASDAAAVGVVLHIVSYGPEADVFSLDAVAQAGGGKHLHVKAETKLNSALQELEDEFSATSIVVAP